MFSAGITEGRIRSWVSAWRYSVTLVRRCQWIGFCTVWVGRAMLAVPYYCKIIAIICFVFSFLWTFFFLRTNVFFALSPRPCWCVSVMSASVGNPSHTMGPCSRTIGSGCTTRPSNQLWSDVMSSPLLRSQWILQHTVGILKYLLKKRPKKTTRVWGIIITFSLKFSQLRLGRYVETSFDLQQILLDTLKLVFLLNRIFLMFF